MQSAVATAPELCSCSKKKRIFASLEAAQAFEAGNRTKYNSLKQRAYECEEVSGTYHLTSLPIEAYDEITVGKNTVSSQIYTLGAPEGNKRTKHSPKHAEIKALKQQGVPVSEISRRTGVPCASVYAYLRSHGPIDSPRGTTKATTKPPTTLEELEKQEQQAQQIVADAERMLANVKSKRSQIIEESRVKVFDGQNQKVTISHHGEFVNLTIDQAYELLTNLTNYLDKADADRPTNGVETVETTETFVTA
jgi:transposase-like protein